MSTANIKVSGNIIGELSTKIPSNIFALNELIKNSYDAFGNKVTIKIEADGQKIVISDDGYGMSAEAISKLFHLAHSTKKYGTEVTYKDKKRYTQGAKGLGFLATFKFGSYVKWVTNHNDIEYTFEVDKQRLIGQDDLLGYEIQVNERPSKKEGTEIHITSSNEIIEDLESYLLEAKNFEKIVGAFTDKDFSINIETPSKSYSTEQLKDFKEILGDRQFIYAKYNSIENVLQLYHLGELVHEEEYLLSHKDYRLDLELVIFSLLTGDKQFIPCLFYREPDNAITPLVFINNNLFNNFTLFDSNIFRQTRSGSSLPQMIGEIKVYSSSELLEFNSDRTNFVESKLTKAIQSDLKELNKIIQSLGSTYKKTYKKEHSKKLKLGLARPQENKEYKSKTAFIQIDRQQQNNFFVPSEQIDLEDFIYQVKNSTGEEVDFNEVEIKVNGEKSENRVLSSIEKPCEIKVEFKYKDETTGDVVSAIELSFKELASPISGGNLEKPLFTFPVHSSYTVSIPNVEDLINAINLANKSKNKRKYLPLIACSLRTIFEISVKTLEKQHPRLFNNQFDHQLLNSRVKKEVKDLLWKKVSELLILLKGNQKLVSAVTNVIDIEYSSLNNLLQISHFKSAVKTTHLGAHQSLNYLTVPTIEHAAKYCGYFAVICDVLHSLDRTQLSAINIDLVSEQDFNHHLGS